MLSSLSNRVPIADIRSAQPPIKESAAIYASAQWRALLNVIIKDRGRICEDINHNHNRTHRLKNELPPVEALGRIYGDHIVELSDGGAPFNKSNIMLRCAVCHGRKTANTALIRRNTKHKPNSKSNSKPIAVEVQDPPNSFVLR